MSAATRHRYIVRDDRILGGEPVIDGTRTPVRAIVEIWRLGVPPESVPQRLWQRAEQLAQRTGRPVADVLAETIELSLKPLGASGGSMRSAADWSNEEVLAASTAQMPAEHDRRLTELLDRQQAGELTGEQRRELAALMDMYQDGLLRKADALREAVRRGMREPLDP
jgi:hypothetical protein